MKHLPFKILKLYVQVVLYCMYREIKIDGLANIPKNKPLLLLSNHQNALLDILLITTQWPVRMWYLARADIFKNALLRKLFTYLQMMPIYRMRDGKATLHKKQSDF